MASSNSQTSTTSAPASFAVAERIEAADSRLMSIASWLSYVTDETARPEARSINRLALQKPASSSSRQLVDVDRPLQARGVDLHPGRPDAHTFH